MNKPHKHAELIKAWADGAEIELQCADGTWTSCADKDYPNWCESVPYRIKPKGWQQELLDAVKAGKVVEYTSGEHYWWVRSDINDYPDSYKFGNNVESQYRIRSTKKVVRWQWRIWDSLHGYNYVTSRLFTKEEAQMHFAGVGCTHLLGPVLNSEVEFDK